MSCMEYRDRRHAVVVGFDDSDGSRRAVRWAAAEAGVRERPLVIVHGLDLHPTTAAYVRHPAVEPVATPRRAAAIRALEPLLAETRHATPDIDVVATLSEADAATALRDITIDLEAKLTVVGSSGRDAIPRVLVGSTTADLVHITDHPVVVVRDGRESPADGAVTVGVDSTKATRRLLAFAFDYAATHGKAVHVVHALGARWLDLVGPLSLSDQEAITPGGSAAELTEGHLIEYLERFPSVTATLEVVDDRPAQVLLDMTSDASLVVVGCGRHGPIQRTVFGSVSHAMLYHANCPVAVVPEPEDETA
nr:Universal stress protein family [Kibdelosporangium sp. MJ126-NF4]